MAGHATREPHLGLPPRFLVGMFHIHLPSSRSVGVGRGGAVPSTPRSEDGQAVACVDAHGVLTPKAYRAAARAEA